MKKYVPPEAEIVFLEKEDVLTVSGAYEYDGYRNDDEWTYGFWNRTDQ